MIDILERWNRWGTATLKGGIEREVTAQLSPFLQSPEVLALIGARRAGKTTVLFQIMDLLEAMGIPKEAMLHINLEEPALSPELSIELLEKIYRLYREEIYPEGRAYIFLDEIQNIPNWERWIRARNDTEDIKFFITGSSSQLMSREMSTVLTGRHISFQVAPLNFKEFLRFQNISLPSSQRSLASSAPLKKALSQFLKWGGFPEVVLAKDEERKRLLLKQYFDDILFKDIALRHAVRDTFALRNLAVYLLTQTGSLVSYQRIAKVFEVSLDLAHSYCQYLQEAFLVDWLPYYSQKAAERQRNPNKVYAIDLGLRNIVSLSASADEGHIIETAVYHALRQTDHDGIFYWKKENEVDFVIRQGVDITRVIQVTTDIEEQAHTLEREQKALVEIEQYFSEAEQSLIVGKMPKERDLKNKKIELISLLSFLLNKKRR